MLKIRCFFIYLEMWALVHASIHALKMLTVNKQLGRCHKLR